MHVNTLNTVRARWAHAVMAQAPLGLSRTDAERLMPQFVTGRLDSHRELLAAAAKANAKRRKSGNGKLTIEDRQQLLNEVRREVGLPAKRYQTP